MLVSRGAVMLQPFFEVVSKSLPIATFCGEKRAGHAGVEETTHVAGKL